MLTRREMLRASTAVIGGTAFGRHVAGASAQEVDPSLDGHELTGLIDMHCHVFNASDLPIYGYLRQVIFKIWDPKEEQSVVPGTEGQPLDEDCDSEEPGWRQWIDWATKPGREGAAEAAANLCYSYIQEPAITAEQELKALQSGVPFSDPSTAVEDPKGVIRKGLKNFFSAPPTLFSDESPDAEVAQWKAEKRDTVGRAVTSGRPPLLQWLREVQQTAKVPSDGAGPSKPPDTQTLFSDTEADSLADFMSTSDDFVSRQVRWVQILKSNRFALAQLIVKTFGKPQDRFALYAPAIIDYSKWLATEPISSLANQGAVMAEISRRFASAGGPRIHGYMAYDPLRDVVEDGKALGVVQTAVKDQGFIGAKVYPTMGFKPFKNVGSRGLTFNKHVLERTSISGARIQNRTAAMLAEELDRRLNEFYGWCSNGEHDVPILTHATASYGAGPGYVCRANPKYWAPAFAKYPNLRVCLGHFGDFGEALETSYEWPNIIFGKKRVAFSKLDKTWEWRFGLLTRGGSRLAFADVSYFNDILHARPDSDEVADLKKALIALIDAFGHIPHHLMYGTDWLLLARERNQQEHFAKVYAFLREVFMKAGGRKAAAWLRGVFRDNAVNFLGLRSGGGTRRRLEAFYDAHGLVDKKTFLSKFDKPLL